MDLNPTPEQLQIIDAVSGYAAEVFPVSRLHSPAGRTIQRVQYAGLGSMGWFGLGIPEELGGVGYNWVEDAMLFRECGRQLVSLTVLATRIAAEVAARAGLTDLAASILEGVVVAAPLRCGPAEALYPAADGRFIVDDWPGTDLLVGWNRRGAALFDVAGIEDLGQAVNIDGTVASHHVALSQATPRAWVAADEHDLSSLARLLGAAMAVGIAEAGRDQAVAYAKVRYQFGKPIGSFQAVQHRCADMAVGAEIAWAQCLIAALSLTDRLPDARQQVIAAVILANRAAVANSRHDIQIHGGMGYSAECDAHLYLKRAHCLAHMFGEGEHDVLAMTGGTGRLANERVACAS